MAFDPFGYFAFASKLTSLLKQGENMAAEFDALKTQITNTETVVQTAVTLLTTLKTSLDAAIANNVPAQAFTDLSTQLGVATAALADAVTKNTPATPAA